MRRKSSFLFLGLLCLAGAFYLWQGGRRNAGPANHFSSANRSATNRAAVNSSPSNSTPLIAKKGGASASTNAAALAVAAKKRFPYRLSNTDQSSGQLVHNERAVLLANALIDTSKPLNLANPERLRAPADNGSYVVQAKGVLNDQFRALLQNANATIVSYIPNNAYLVRVSAEGAQQLAAAAGTQSVLPYEPYYKLDASLLKLAMEHPEQLPPNGRLNLTLFADGAEQTLAKLQGLGTQVLAQERSPFGPVVTVQPVAGTLAAIASLPGVQGVSSVHGRVQANDLDRVRLNVAANSLAATPNYLGLTGSNVLVSINDGGVDAGQLDLANRILSVSNAIIATNALTDVSGHGTHVAGTILGSGLESPIRPTPQGSATNASFRGMAPNATAFSLPIFAGSNFFFSMPDSYLQEQPARTNALISNNSWNYGGAHEYDIQAASYDAAVRDALPQVTGSQPVLFVFSAGNDGGGYDDGTGGSSDSILSPATAKNVITVGAMEQPRFITNLVVVDGVTNNEMYNATDNATQVASFSSRGNVGINVEGDHGRFKPDLVAPGTFVISDRSGQWDTNAYYNPTNYAFYYYTSNLVTTNATNSFLFPVPIGAVGLIITLQTNGLTGYTNMPPLPIYLGFNNFPTDSGPPNGTNVVSLPTNSLLLNGGDTIYFDVINTWTNAVNYNVQIEVLTTNDVGNYFQVLSNMNNALGPYYRYESGTSMAAAGVSGMLALMQEFFQQRMHVTNSPALMKALLINGARSLSDQYDLAVANPNQPTFQGWGLPSLPNCIPPALSNANSGNLSSMPLQFFDQNPSNALATGQSQSRTVNLTADALVRDLRITLVWTDPPGSPQAGVKLVNDLDLIVSNTVTHEVFYGNDIPAGSSFNQAWDTNGAPNLDSVNNVENVYLSAPVSGSYTVTVLGRRVNVNAVTGTTNGIVQDYALVISSGNASATAGGLSVTDANGGVIITNNKVSNVFALSNNVPLLNQRVGAHSQFSGSTNGTASQWNFYIYTNTAASSNASYTNVAFVTFQPPNLGVPRMGASTEVTPPDLNATRFAGADIDLYVSMDPTLTNLNPAAVSNSFKAIGRLGSEVVFFTNSGAGQVYYIGVKSEDQQAAQFNLIGFATDIPFSQQGTNGNAIVNMNPVPLTIPGGTPTSPQSTFLIGICINPMQVRKVVVTNTVTAQDFGDYIGSLSEGRSSAVLNNHSFFTNVNDVTETLVYDDSGESEFPGALKSAGPGSLKNFVGINALGSAWTYTIVNDSSPTDSGSISNMTLVLEPQPPANSGFNPLPQLGANSWYYGFVDVPANATNLTISISGSTGPIDLLIQEASTPSFASYQKKTNLPAPGGSLSLSKYDSPPLNAGRYFFAIHTVNAEANLSLQIKLDYSLTPNAALTFISNTNQLLLDDAVTYSTNHVSNDSTVVSAEVGVRIQHPRESDLVLTLISPQGTRVLLAENRGGTDTNGYGTGTNYVLGFAATSGGAATFTTNINVGANVGVINMSYNFFTIPDEMAIFYDGVKIYDTGMISGSGNLVVPFGPGNSQNITVMMNPYGNSSGTNGDLWNFSAFITAQNLSYVTFSEDTNITTTPIKFAVPPFGSGAAFLPAQTVVSNGFEGIAAASYGLGANIDGAWTVTATNSFISTTPTVVTVPALAALGGNGTNVLALHNGTISRVLPTVVGRKYTLTLANHGRPFVTPVSWWKGDDSTEDSADGNNLYNLTANSVSYAPGVVGQAFVVNDSIKLRAADAPNMILTNSLSIEGWINASSDFGIIMQRGDLRGGNDPYTLSMGNPIGGSQASVGFGITDTNDVNVRVDGPMPLNQFTHVAGTYQWIDTNAVLTLYINGLPLALTNTDRRPIGNLIPSQDPGFGFGNRPDLINQFSFQGLMDEITLYNNALSAAQVQDIYAAGSAGKNPVGETPPVTAEVIFGGTAHEIAGEDAWTSQIYHFTATSDRMTLTIAPNEDGMLLDAIQLVQDSMPNATNYYLPEESLAKLAGESSLGDWQLEVLDNRTGATNPAPQLVSWKLNLVLTDKVAFPLPLNNGVPQTNTVAPGSITYFEVNVPTWANAATNLLLSATGPVNLLFNQNGLPTGTNSGDYSLLTGQTTGSRTLLMNGAAPLLQPGQIYYLGVQNTGASPVSFALEVFFDITPLTNRVRAVGVIGNAPRYFEYTVSANNPIMTEFAILSSSGNVELVARKGLPLPDTNNFDYITDIPGTNQQDILVLTNSMPVALSPGTWYLGVFNNEITNSVKFKIEAIEVDQGDLRITELSNNVPIVTNTLPTGLVLTNFYHFYIASNVPAALFELYNITNGNVDLTLQRGTYPFGQPYFASSFNSGTNREQIVLRTNLLGTNILGDWYLGVPNNSAGKVNYTIRAVTSTNGFLQSGVPFHLTSILPPPGAPYGLTLTWPGATGNYYEIQSTTNLFSPWTNLITVVADGETVSFTDPNPVTNAPAQYYRIVTLPSP